MSCRFPSTAAASASSRQSRANSEDPTQVDTATQAVVGLHTVSGRPVSHSSPIDRPATPPRAGVAPTRLLRDARQRGVPLRTRPHLPQAWPAGCGVATLTTPLTMPANPCPLRRFREQPAYRSSGGSGTDCSVGPGALLDVVEGSDAESSFVIA
jgi:hypothetical protein